MKTVSCILAGGKSKRFGNDKRFAFLNGKKLIDYALQVASEISDDVYISTRHNETLEGYKIIKDRKPFLGPACGIANVIKEVSADIYVFLAADMPFVKKEHISRLIDAIDKKPMAVCYKQNNKLKTLPIVIYDPDKEILKMDCSNRRILDLIENIGIKTIKTDNELIFFNINNYSDLKEAEKILLYSKKI